MRSGGLTAAGGKRRCCLSMTGMRHERMIDLSQSITPYMSKTHRPTHARIIKHTPPQSITPSLIDHAVLSKKHGRDFGRCFIESRLYMDDEDWWESACCIWHLFYLPSVRCFFVFTLLSPIHPPTHPPNRFTDLVMNIEVYDNRDNFLFFSACGPVALTEEGGWVVCLSVCLLPFRFFVCFTATLKPDSLCMHFDMSVMLISLAEEGGWVLLPAFMHACILIGCWRCLSSSVRCFLICLWWLLLLPACLPLCTSSSSSPPAGPGP